MPRTWEDPSEDTSGDRGAPQLALPLLTKATRILLIANASIFVVSFAVYLASSEVWISVEHALGLSPSAWRNAFPLVPVWQLLTYGFLHSVTDISHVLLNMLSLYFFGTMLEGMLGTRRFVVAYFSAQLVGALIFLVPGLFGSEMGLAIGASGAVFGVMIAVATLRPRQRVLFLFIPVSLGFLALVFVAITLFGAALQWKTGDGGGTAHLVHLGGIAYGFLAVKSGLIYADPMAAMARARAARDVERRQSDDARIDQLLEKINREGMSSLSRGEREFLKRISTRR